MPRFTAIGHNMADGRRVYRVMDRRGPAYVKICGEEGPDTLVADIYESTAWGHFDLANHISKIMNAKNAKNPRPEELRP